MERTFLAWLRTALALMGFGFVVARFGLFLREIAFERGTRAPPGHGFSVWFGTALILLGSGISAWAWRRYRWLIGELASGGSGIKRPSWGARTSAIVLALIGIAMAVTLVAVGRST